MPSGHTPTAPLVPLHTSQSASRAFGKMLQGKRETCGPHPCGALLLVPVGLHCDPSQRGQAQLSQALSLARDSFSIYFPLLQMLLYVTEDKVCVFIRLLHGMGDSEQKE